MKRRPADQVLADVVRGLEVPRRQRDAVRLLLAEGPYRIRPEVIADLDAAPFPVVVGDVVLLDNSIPMVCAQLAMFVSAVARRGTDSFGLVGRLSYEVHSQLRGDQIAIKVDGTNLRDLAFIQLQGLMLAGGLHRICVCASPLLRRGLAGEHFLLPCGRLYVRTRKQKYCSVTCQRRAAIRRKRDKDRIKAEAQARRRRRT